MDLDLFKIINAIIGFIILPYTILTGRLHVRINKLEEASKSVYTKEETKEILELVTKPMKETTEKLIESQDRVTDALHRIELKIASHINEK